MEFSLPAELWETVAEFLAGDNKLGSLASLNVTNRNFHQITSAVLWTTVTLDAFTPRWNEVLKKLPSDDVDDTSEARERTAEAAMEEFERCKDLPGTLPANRRYVK
jgi:hypothetical protein